MSGIASQQPTKTRHNFSTLPKAEAACMRPLIFVLLAAPFPCHSLESRCASHDELKACEHSSQSDEENFTEQKSYPTYTKDKLRLKPYEPSYLVIKSHASGLNKFKEEYTSLNAHFSFSYDFYYPKSQLWKVFGSYTGEFDFYFQTRESDPVINRLNNPALHLRLADTASWPQKLTADYIDFAIEHKSDGQTKRIDAENLAEANVAYQSGDERYFDDFDMGDNFFSTELKFHRSRQSLYIKLKLYPEGKEEEINWGDLAGQQVTIEDFDRWRFLYAARQKNGNQFSAEWTLGDRWFKSDSFNFDYMFNVKNALPLYIRYHSGPLETQSNYSYPVDSIAIGIKLAPYL